MEAAISPNSSPTSTAPCYTPRTTPLRVNILPPPTYSLPPISSFPNWNRTKLSNKRFPSKIKKDEKIQFIGSIDHSDRFTQTTPPSLKNFKAIKMPMNNYMNFNMSSTLTNDHRNNVSIEKDSNQQIYEKKISFLQESHQEVLSSLHKEVESLKNQNKALQFELVSRENCGQRYKREHESLNNMHKSDDRLDNNKQKVYLLEQEIKSLRENLLEEQKRNTDLIHSLEYGKERSISALTAKNKQSIDNPKSSALVINNSSKQKSLSARQNIDIKRNEPYEETKVSDLKLFTSAQQKETNNMLNESTDHPSKRRTILPSVVTTNLRLDHVNARSSTNHNPYHKPNDSFTLPKIQTTSSSKQNMSERQKRARFNHVKRQKSNRSLFLGISGVK